MKQKHYDGLKRIVKLAIMTGGAYWILHALFTHPL